MAGDDRAGNVYKLVAVVLGVFAEHPEGLVGVDRVAGHQDSLGLFYQRATAERPLQVVVFREALQGHVDCVSPIIAFDREGTDFRLEVELPETFAHYVASKGSIGVDGISLTVAEVLPKSFVVWIIPYTKHHTNLDRAKTGDLVNVEFDILAKYVETMVAPSVIKK